MKTINHLKKKTIFGIDESLNDFEGLGAPSEKERQDTLKNAIKEDAKCIGGKIMNLIKNDR